eukprot:COSAG01_NODE_2443_length_7689_cov_5.414229_2_plen_139_part_00
MCGALHTAAAAKTAAAAAPTKGREGAPTRKAKVLPAPVSATPTKSTGSWPATAQHTAWIGVGLPPATPAPSGSPPPPLLLLLLLGAADACGGDGRDEAGSELRQAEQLTRALEALHRLQPPDSTARTHARATPCIKEY